VRCERGAGHVDSVALGSARELSDLGPIWRPVAPRPVRLPRTWRDVVTLRGVTVIDEALVIEPGTLVRLDADASLVLRGQVLARGTAQAPIRFAPLGDQPWGALALQGQGANGSRFSHCQWRDGSGYKTDLFEYSAMLSLHDVRDVHLEHCELRDSRIVDDMLHTVYADVDIDACTFAGALADAVDLDNSAATFTRCTFTLAGNDGLDLMTSSALVVDCIFERCGDKGISVGESSRALVVRPKIMQCNFGVQSKDKAFVALFAAELTGNKGALDAYQKNWRYGGGGRVFAYGCRLHGNGKLATADKESFILLRGCMLDGAVTPSPGRIVVDGSPGLGAWRRDEEERRALREVEARRPDVLRVGD
jgi:hypothetical protein